MVKKALIIFVALLFSCSFGFAEDIYIAQSSAGGDTGANCANAHAITWFNTAGNWGADAGDITAGDTVHFCGTLTSKATVQGSGSAGNPITIIFESGAKFSSAYWGIETNAALSAENKNYIVIDGGTNGTIEATDNGSPNTTTPAGTFAHQADSVGIYYGACHNCTIRNMIIKDMYQRVTDSDDSAMVGRAITLHNCNDATVHSNTITDAYYGIYARASTDNRNNLYIYDNDISAVSTGIVVGLAEPVNYSNVYIYGNKLYGFNVWDGCWNSCTVWQHNDGIHIWGNYVNNTVGPVYIYNNEIGGDFGAHTSSWIFIEDYGTPVYVYNNLLYTTAEKPTDGYITLGSRKDGAVAKVYNNTIKGAGTDNTGGQGIYLSNLGGGWVADIQNNIITNCYVAINDKPGLSTITSDYNDFYNNGNVGRREEAASGDTWFETLASWRTFWGGCPGSGNECNSVTTDPVFTSSSDFTLQATSTVKEAGNDLSGATPAITLDMLGNSRSVPYSMGAYEYGGAEPPPTQYTLTVTKAGTGAGGVTSSPAGINCGATCTYDYDENTEVTLTATPTGSDVFAGWSGTGGCTGTSTCVLTMSAAKAATATFNLPTLPVRFSGGGFSGTIQ